MVPRLPCGVSPGEHMPAQVPSDQHLGRRPSWDVEKGEMPAGGGGQLGREAAAWVLQGQRDRRGEVGTWEGSALWGGGH